MQRREKMGCRVRGGWPLCRYLKEWKSESRVEVDLLWSKGSLSFGAFTCIGLSVMGAAGPCQVFSRGRERCFAIRECFYASLSVKMLRVSPKQVNNYSKVIPRAPIICCNFWSHSPWIWTSFCICGFIRFSTRTFHCHNYMFQVWTNLYPL